MTTRDVWDPGRYERFQFERSLPFFDLLALVCPVPGLRIVDLGCGTGALTRRLHDQLRPLETVGVDCSAAMLKQCEPHVTDGLSFRVGDLGALDLEGRFDLVFSNAALHWVEDHPALLRRLVPLLNPGGQLAVQVPANHEHPSQTLAATVASRPTFAEALEGYVRHAPVLSATRYAEELHELGFAEQSVASRVYVHELPDREAMVEWVRGTTLTDYERRMPADLYEKFLEEYRIEVARVFPEATPFFFPFQRTLLWGQLDG
ncbi:MAG: methyltransferase domain-containing protein [Planctomycetota bacterium]|nr:methyltransferase domain-containing protein [Planctomycetota bacterium]